MKEAVSNLGREEAMPVFPLRQGIDDIGYKGGKEEPQILQVRHHSVVLGLQTISMYK